MDDETRLDLADGSVAIQAAFHRAARKFKESQHRRDGAGRFTFKPGGLVDAVVAEQFGPNTERPLPRNPVVAEIDDEALEETEGEIRSRSRWTAPTASAPPSRMVPTPGGSAMVPLRGRMKLAKTTTPLTREYREGEEDRAITIAQMIDEGMSPTDVHKALKSQGMVQGDMGPWIGVMSPSDVRNDAIMDAFRLVKDRRKLQSFARAIRAYREDGEDIDVGVEPEGFSHLSKIFITGGSGEFVPDREDEFGGFTDMSRSVDTEDMMLFSQSTVKAVLKVHKIPTKVNGFRVPKVTWSELDPDGDQNFGRYEGFLHFFREGVDPADMADDMDKPGILVDTTMPSMLAKYVIAHELGHYMDQVINFATADRKFHNWGSDRSLTRNESVARLFETMDRSELIRRMEEARVETTPMGNQIIVNVEDNGYAVSPEWRKYMLSSSEKFAIAYSQWIATRSGDESLARALKVHQSRPDNPWRRVWSDDEFIPIGEALDDLFEELGWSA